MGISNNSHGKKFDKETQSPLLKIFKEVMTREKDDSEKRTLLTEQKDDKKRRQYSGSRNKLDRRSCDSSCSDHRKRGAEFKRPPTEQRAAEYKQSRQPNMPYQSEKKESWWFWQKDGTRRPNDNDTCSCVSCALKRIISSEYACVGCLLLIFTISIIVAFLVVCKSVPSFQPEPTTTLKPKPKPKPCKPCKEPPCKEPPCKPCKEPPCKEPNCKECKCKPCDSERLKRKIELLSGKNYITDMDFDHKNYKEGYEDDGIGHLAGASGVDFGPSFRELNSLDESESKLSPEVDLSNVLEGEKIGENLQSSEKLKDFYKKLVQTDAKIKYLKQLNPENYLEPEEGPRKSPDRSKRSLKLYYPNNYRYQAIRRNRRSVRQKERKNNKFNDKNLHLKKRQGQNNTRISQNIRSNKRQQNNTRSKEHNKETEENVLYAETQYKKRQGQNNTKIAKTKLSDAPLKKRQQNQTRLYGKPKEDQPTGFVIEKKKLIVQYKPANSLKKVPVKKCSHAPKDLHVVQEHQLKHPFYKNTQRLDELLDRFLNKNLPEIMSDPFGLDMLFKHEKQKCKHPKPTIVFKSEPLVDQIPKPKSKQKKPKEEVEENQTEQVKYMRPETSTQYEKQFFIHEEQLIGKEKQKIVTASPNDFEVLLSVSTIMNPEIKKTGKLPSNHAPNARQLMQLDGEDDENLGYEDFKEVLKDDVENHDDMDKSRDKRKRDVNAQQPPAPQTPPTQPLPPEKLLKQNPPGVHNPNWKGPMPLYPDELNSMIQHAALNANKIELPNNSNDLQALFLERKARDLSDVEYVEDYLNNKYDRLVEMAQAYSDYGVLDGKKDSRNEKNSPSDITLPDHRVKLSSNKGFMEKLQKGRHPSVVTESSFTARGSRQASSTDTETTTTEQNEGGSSNTLLLNAPPTTVKEGIRFELRPTTKAREDEELNQWLSHKTQFLGKHFKVEKTSSTTASTTAKRKEAPVHSTLISTYPDMELIYSKNNNAPTQKKIKFKLKSDSKLKGKDIPLDKIHTQVPKLKSKDIPLDKVQTQIFSFIRGQRKLFSTDSKITSTISDLDEYEEEISHTDDMMHVTQKTRSFNFQKFNKPTQEALARYWDKVKNKNIKICSSTHNSGLKNDTSSVKVSVTSPTAIKKLISMSTRTDVSEVDKIHLPPITPLRYPPTKYANTVTQSLSTTGLPDSVMPTNTGQEQSVTNVEILNVDPEQEHHRRIANILMPTTILPVSPFNMVFAKDIPEKAQIPVTKVGDTVISIDRSEINLDKTIGDNCAGKIVLTVEDPDIGTESIDINFDIPLVISFNDDFGIPINDNYTFKSNLNELDFTTELFFDPGSNDTEFPTETGINPNDVNNNQAKRRRYKRNAFESKDVDEILRSYTYEGLKEVEDQITTTSTTVNPTVTLDTQAPVLNQTDDNMSLSDFLMMVSDWFKSLEGMKSNTRDPAQALADLLSKLSHGSETTPETTTTSTTTSATTTTTTVETTTVAVDDIPNYDSDMIENIGHRSRVLLSVEDINTNETTSSSYNNTSTMALAMTNATETMVRTSPDYQGGNAHNTYAKTTKSHAKTTKSYSKTTKSYAQTTKSHAKTTNSYAKTKSHAKTTKSYSKTTKSHAKTTKSYAKTTKSHAKTTTSTRRTYKLTKKPLTVMKATNKMASVKKMKTVSKNNNMKKKPKSKQVVKRNADDSNLIFWDDIYDDEYGVQSDKLDNLRNKHSVEQNDFIKRSGRWVHEKFRKFAENLKRNPRQEDVAIKERVPRSVKTQYIMKDSGAENYPKYVYEQPVSDDRLHREPAAEELEEEDYDAEQKSMFAALSANMKEVCKKAARAVQQTRNIEVREDSHQGTIATSLMQQLVRLLTDLVDYQVQQKTCTKLPPDLQTFLEWLTQPRELLADGTADTLNFRPPFQEEDLIEELELATTDEKTTESSEAQQPPKPGQTQVVDARLHYLDCLHSVQELIEQYEDMSDDDKSKMTGVKTYLENQMLYLNKFLANYDLFSIFENHKQKMRMKRDIKPKRHLPLRRRKRRKVNKFIRNFGKKHTRTTAGFYDAMIQITERKKKMAEFEIKDAKLEVNDVKRNLKDVYYKAVAEAKKYATEKVSTEGDPSYGTTVEPALRKT